MREELQNKVERAVKLLQAAGKIAKEHGQPLEVAYSGGKDSDVILELTRMAGVEYRAIYKNTTIDPPQTIRHAMEMGAEMIRPTKSFRELIALHGFPLTYAPLLLFLPKRIQGAGLLRYRCKARGKQEESREIQRARGLSGVLQKREGASVSPNS